VYYVLTNKVEDDDGDAIFEGFSRYLNRINCSFKEGLSLSFDDVETPILFEVHEFSLRGNVTDYLSIDNIPGPVFSASVKALFERLEICNIQYFQITLLDEFVGVQTGTPKKPKIEFRTVEYTDYFIANVVGLVDCVDHKKSIVEYFYPPELRNRAKEQYPNNDDEIINPFADDNPDDVDFITKLVLDENKIDPGLKIFRLKDQPDLLLFHDSLVELIRKEKLSGFVFVPVSEYTDAISDDDKQTKDEKAIREESKEHTEKKHELEEGPSSPEQPAGQKKRRLLF